MLSRFLTTITEQRRTEVARELAQASSISVDYVVLAVLSCLIATFGLIVNSGPVIIGAMLIAPLMPTILGLALALVQGSPRRAVTSLVTLGAGFLLAFTLSAVLARAVSGSRFNFLVELPAEILGRTEPTLFDLAIAVAGGAAAAYALAQPRVSAALPGVAIATALMPPVCVIGIGVSQGRGDVAGGALLLFLANFAAIEFAGAIVFLLVGFRAQRSGRRLLRVPMALVVSCFFVLLVTLPLIMFMVRIVGDVTENATIRHVITTELSEINANNSLVEFQRRWQDDHLEITATVRVAQDLTAEDGNEIQQELATQLQRPVALTLLMVPITRLEPVTPVPRTPKPQTVVPFQPAATVVPTATRNADPTASPSASPDATPAVTVGPTPPPRPVQ